MQNVFVSKRTIPIYYADTDMMGVVYHANYVKYYEAIRSALIEDLGFSYLAMEEAGYYAPIRDVQVTYLKPLRYGDKAVLEAWIEKNDGVKTLYGYKIMNDKGELCAEGTSTHIIVKKDTFKPVAFKKAFPEWFQKYEEIKKQK